MPRLPTTPLTPKLPQVTLDYLSNGASEGQRNAAAFAAAVQFRDAKKTVDEAMAAIVPRGMADGLSEHEVRTAIRSAYSRPPREPIGMSGSLTLPILRYSRPQKPKYPKRKVEGIKPQQLPMSIPCGDRVIVETAFRSGEYLSIGTTNFSNDRFMPDAGTTYERDAFLRMLDRFNGIRGIHWLNDANGTYIRVNPICDNGRTDADVISFRHVVVEFDKDALGNPIPKELQYAYLLDSKMPMSVIIDSGNKSIHAWIKVDAADAVEYRDRVDRIYAWFSDLHLDNHNGNPSRYSRMPGVQRNLRNEDGNIRCVSQQVLLAINVGCANWEDWTNQGLDVPEL